MKVVVALLAVAVFASATPLRSGCRRAARHSPEDDDPLRVKYLMFLDERGKFHFEDLTKPRIEIRAQIQHVTLFLYTRKNQNNPVMLKVEDLNGLINSNVYDPSKPNHFIIHGWQNDNESEINNILKAAMLKMADVNVFIVDWGVVANYNYWSARYAIDDIGQYVGNYVNLMIEHYGIPTSFIKLVGHSLGAHIAGYIGDEVLQKHGLVASIVGLDPAGPLFTARNTDNRLHTDDAAHVQIIHTSGSLLGWVSDLGHSDFYPNGGRSQPGCGFDPIGSCAHSRSYYFYEESILSGGFISTECDSYKKYNKGKCNDRHVSQFGGLEVDKSACGDYYFDTNKKMPFSKN